MNQRCKICSGESIEHGHNNTRNHIFNFLLYQWRNYRKALIKDRHGITLKVEPQIDNELRQKLRYIEKKGCYHLSVTPNELQQHNNLLDFHCTITNIMKDKSVFLTSADILHPYRYYNLIDPTGLMEQGLVPQLKPNAKYSIIVRFQPDDMILANFKMPVSFNFQTVEEKPDTFSIARSILISVEEEVYEARNEEKSSPFTNTGWGKDVKIIPPTDKSSRTLTEYSIPDKYYGLILNQLEDLKLINGKLIATSSKQHLDELRQKLLPGKVTLNNYKDFFHIMLWLEEIWTKRSLSNYNMENVRLTMQGRRMLNLKVPGLAEKRPSIIVGDLIDIRIHDDHRGYQGVITSVNDTTVDISYVHSELLEFIRTRPGIEMDVRFVLGRLVYVRKHRAVDQVVKNHLAQFLFPSRDFGLSPAPVMDCIENQDFFNLDVLRNREQTQAVINIVNNTSRSCPYIVFGPPGTGKTVTIVEAMLQIKRMTKRRILVCAPANAACNMLASKLVPYCTKKELIRVCSQAMDKQLLTDDLIPYTNCIEDELVSISSEQLMGYRIVVTTLILAGKYAYSSYHPDVIFIDEAAQASEPEAIVPLGLFGKEKMQLVLAGDPKQLGPIVGSKKAVEFGLGKSLLERLMDLDLYKPCWNMAQFNANFITMLIRNFRSHRDILDIPNRLFYMNRLQAVSERSHNDPISQIFIYNHIKGFYGNKIKKRLCNSPIEFCSVIAKEMREGRSPSYFNPKEITMVQKYVQAICSLPFPDYKSRVTPNQIGIVTPYIRQVYKIKHILEHQYPGIEVGTTEAFQGREKRVIILSTVRGQQDLLLYDRKYDLGFVSNAKRFNVALTRAMSKLIIIGNPLVLGTDTKWLQFITKCESVGSFCGAPYTRRTDQVKAEVTNKFGKMYMQDSAYNG